LANLPMINLSSPNKYLTPKSGHRQVIKPSSSRSDPPEQANSRLYPGFYWPPLYSVEVSRFAFKVLYIVLFLIVNRCKSLDNPMPEWPHPIILRPCHGPLQWEVGSNMLRGRLMSRHQVNELFGGHGMPRISLCFILILIFVVCATLGAAQKVADTKSRITLNFNQTEYVHRWSQNDQHEFTPPGQEDLSKWIDMLTINFYQQVSSGEGLASVANQILENYKTNKGRVLRTDSVPRTIEKPAEHLIVVVFGRPTFLEAVQARFKLVNGTGVGIIYSHRVYGKEAGPEMSTWLKGNGPSVEKALMAWEFPPSLGSLQKSSAPKGKPRD
jgi:hypothetical protein